MIKKSDNIFSIIIPCRRISNFLLKKTLPAITSQSYPFYQIIIVTNQLKITKIPQVEIIKTDNTNPAHMRNLGAKKAKGPYLCFIDDDVYPSFNWLNNASRLLKLHPHKSAVCGPNLTPAKSSFSQKLSGCFWQSPLGAGQFYYRNLPAKSRLVNDFPSSNLIIKKSAFNQIKGFDCHFWPGEDTKLCHDLVYKLKKPILYHPSLTVYHQRRSFPQKHLLQLNRYATHRGFFVKYLPKTSKLPVYFLPSIFSLYQIMLMSLYIIKSPFNLLNQVLTLPFYLYAVLTVLNSLWLIKHRHPIIASILSIPVIIVSHFSYGIFFIIGLLKKDLLR